MTTALWSLAIIGSGIALAACSSGVMQLGPDTYRISLEGVTLGGSEADAITTAGRHCTSMSKRLNVMSMQGTPMSYATYATATVNFQCVPLSAQATR